LKVLVVCAVNCESKNNCRLSSDNDRQFRPTAHA